MNKLLKIFAIIILSSAVTQAQYGWQWANPSPTGNNISGIQFVNNNTGFGVSYCDLVKTTNAGLNWSLIYTNKNVNINSSYFINSQTGFAVGLQGTILKTTNGGNIWSTQYNGWENNTLFFASALSGWFTSFNGSTATILATTNGGVNWFAQFSNNSYYFSMDFISTLTGWASGYSIVRTTNGGTNWITIPKPTGEFWNVDFLSRDTGWIVGTSGSIYKTINGGQNWIAQSSGTVDLLIDINMLSLEEGYVTSKSWVNIKNYRRGFKLDLKNKRYDLSYKFSFFISPSTGFAASSINTILKTTDNGELWTQYLQSPYNNFNSVDFYNKVTGWICGDGGFIQNTTNSGLNWSIKNSTTVNNLYSISIASPSSIWMSGDLGTIIHSSNNGKSEFNFFVNELTGFAAGGAPFQQPIFVQEKQLIMKTTNGGINWVSVLDINDYELSKIQFVSELTGWAINSRLGRKFIKTTNGGISWANIDIPLGIYSFHFLNMDTGVICGEMGAVYKTTNGGTIWIQQPTGTFRDLNSIFLTSDKNGYTAGAIGTLLTTSSGGNSPYILNSRQLIEGFYDTNLNQMTGDSVSIYLRNPTAPYQVIDSSVKMIGSTGDGRFTFLNANNSVPYIISAKHRNSIETWSSNIITFAGNSGSYDFTISSAQAYGYNMKLVGTKWTFYSGDVNQDGTVDASDQSEVDNDVTNSVSGYVQTDLTGDDFVDGSDLSIVENNAAASVSVITP
ncbi:MAG: hypothetical protein IPH77_15060 [Ignavibacteria bacterium]|nr:hypothetical protein [Ignavibacteria bacterium]